MKAPTTRCDSNFVQQQISDQAVQTVSRNYWLLEHYGLRREADQILLKALSKKDEDQHQSYRYEISRIPKTGATSIFAQALKHPDVTNKEDIVMSLAHFNDEISAGIAIDHIELISEESLPSFLEFLAASKTDVAKKFIAENYPEILEKKSERKEKVVVIEELPEVSVPLTSQQLVRRVFEDKVDPREEARAVTLKFEALLTIFSDSPDRGPDRGMALTELKSYLNSTDPYKRSLAASAVGYLAPEAVKDIILNELSGDKQSQQYVETVSVLLGSIKQPAIENLPLELLKSKNDSLRCSVASAISRSNSQRTESKLDKAALEILKDNLSNKDPGIRAVVVAGLAGSRREEAARILIGRTVAEEEPIVRMQLELGLRRLFDDLGLRGSLSDNILAFTNKQTDLKLVEARKYIQMAKQYGLDETSLRIPPPILREVIRSSEKSSAYSVLVILAPADNDGATNIAITKLKKHLLLGHNVTIVEPNSEDDLYNKTVRYQTDPRQHLIRIGHATEDQMSLTNRDPARGGSWDDQGTINLSDTKRMRDRGFDKILARGGTITIIGCSSADGYGMKDNLANSDWRAFPQAGRLEASTAPMNVYHIATGPSDRTRFTSGSEFTYFLERKN